MIRGLDPEVSGLSNMERGQEEDEKSSHFSNEFWSHSPTPTLYPRSSEDIENAGYKIDSSHVDQKADNVHLPAPDPELPAISSLSPLEVSSIPEASNGVKVLQVIASFFPYMNSSGLVNSFGIFQAYYSLQYVPLESESNIAWIGSIQLFLLMFLAMLIGPVIDAGYLRHVLIVATVLTGFGMIILGWCDQYYQLMLTQGLMVGVGTGCGFVPSISVIPQWFPAGKSCTLALGIVATGSAIGAIIYPIMFHYIQQASGFGWAVRAIGLMILGTNLFSIFTLRYRTLPSERRSLVDVSMFKEKSFRALCLSFIILFMGVYVPTFFIQSYAATQDTASSSSSPSSSSSIFWIVPILTGASGVGRVVLNIVAGQVGILNVTIAVVATCALLALCWIAVHSTGAVVVFAVFYGFMSGGFVSLVPPVIVSTAPHKNKLATRIGMALACGAIGVLVGNPVAGAILNSTHRYTGMQVFAGVTLFVSTFALVWLRFLKVGTVLRARV